MTLELFKDKGSLGGKLKIPTWIGKDLVVNTEQNFPFSAYQYRRLAALYEVHSICCPYKQMKNRAEKGN
jgi:hypothetical protein